MNLSSLNKRLDTLSEKLADEPKEYIGRFDDSTFTDAEKALFKKVEALLEEHNNRLPPDILKANKDIICKAHMILYRYAVGTLKFMLLTLIGDPNRKYDQFDFDIAYWRFVYQLKEELKDNRKYENENEGSLSPKTPEATTDSGMQSAEKTECTKVDDNEHYDPYYQI
jgi:hypothetical protein